MKIIKRRWKAGWNCKLTVEQVAAELYKIRQTCGEVTPERVVKVSESKSHPLHHVIYRHSDEKAAHLYRLTMARTLIQHVECNLELANGKTAWTREYECVSIEGSDDQKGRKGGRIYVPVIEISKNEWQSANVLDNARSELAGWKRRYEVLAQVVRPMRPVFQAIKKVGL